MVSSEICRTQIPRTKIKKNINIWKSFQCQGLVIQEKGLQPNLTQEMTSGELKFALAVETVLNSIPQPEYRQLVVEALMVLTLVVEYKAVANLGGTIHVEQLVHSANQIFLEDQVSFSNTALTEGNKVINSRVNRTLLGLCKQTGCQNNELYFSDCTK